MNRIDDLLLRAVDRGVQVFGITPMDIPGRGVGLIATRNLKVLRNFGIAARLINRYSERGNYYDSSDSGYSQPTYRSQKHC